MKKIVLFLFMLPCILFSQVQDPCSNSIIDYLTDHENANKPISYQLSQGWNMVGYYGTAQNNEMSTQINEESLSDSSTIEETFQVIKNVSGQFWSPEFSQLNTLTPGEGYMMYVITDNPPAISFNAQFQMPQISGCTNCLAENFRPIATVDDGSCLILGCTSDWADNYNPEATENNGSCSRIGCMDINALNYDAIANIGGTDECIYPPISVADFDFVPTPTDNNMSVVFPVGTLNDFIGGSLMAFKADGTPVSASSEILEDGSGGIAPHGTDAYCGCDYLSSGEQLTFAILMNDQTIVLVDVNPPLTYQGNTFEMISGDISFSIDGAPVVFGCTDSEANNYDELATIDNGSCDVNLSIAVGDLAEGGIVFYVDETGEHGLVAAMEDLTEGATDPYGYGSNGYEWGCYQQVVNGADGQAIGTGYQNTLDIVNQGCVTDNGGITASQAALDAEINGYSDWYLPSKDELIEMYNTIGNGGLEGNIGGFETNDRPYYSSSSEFSSYTAWYVIFYNGNTSYYYYNKTNPGRVRVIRAF